MLQLVLGALSLGALCAAWVAWQRFAERVHPGAASDTRAGGRCCVPRDTHASERGRGEQTR